MSDKTQIVVTGSITTIENAVDAAFLYEEVDRLKRTARRMSDELEKELLEWSRREKVDKVILDADRELVFKQKTKNRFDTDAVYKALEFTPEQVAVLPANPAFRKTAILENEKTAPAFYEDIEDVIEVKELNKKFLKEAQFKKELAAKAKGE